MELEAMSSNWCLSYNIIIAEWRAAELKGKAEMTS